MHIYIYIYIYIYICIGAHLEEFKGLCSCLFSMQARSCPQILKLI